MRSKHYYLLLLLFLVASCKKFLAAPADTSVQVPNTVGIYQGMMDKNSLTNNSTPGLGPVYMNTYYTSGIAATDSFSIGLYTWRPELFEDGISLSWGNPYDAINTCNTVLTEVPKLSGLDSADRAAAAFVMGQAYFLRAFMYYHLEETFGQPFRPGSAASDPGVPLRLNENVMDRPQRAHVAEVYRQMVSDLEQAVLLLPMSLQTANRNRPCRSAAYGLLARVWLTEQRYDSAKVAADNSLILYDSLVDLNAVDSSLSRPFGTYAASNSEVLFQCTAYNYPTLQYGRSILVDSMLHASYGQNDLRRVIYFQISKTTSTSTGTGGGSGMGYYFKGQYSGTVYLFSGMAVDEILLIRAESKAWMGDLSGALADVDALRVKRWRRGAYVPFSVSGMTQDSVLRIVIGEKGKELVFREGPFYDLRRLNQYPAYADTLSRVFGGTVYTLMPGSPRYAFPIPPGEISLGGEMQNPE